MDKEALVSAGLDYDDGVRRCGGNADLYEQLLGMFLDDTNMEEARKHLAEGDYQALFGSVHEIKGLSGNLSISELYHTASNMVELLRAGNNEAAQQAFADVEAAYNTAITAIAAQKG